MPAFLLAVAEVGGASVVHWWRDGTAISEYAGGTSRGMVFYLHAISEGNKTIHSVPRLWKHSYYHQGGSGDLKTDSNH